MSDHQGKQIIRHTIQNSFLQDFRTMFIPIDSRLYTRGLIIDLFILSCFPERGRKAERSRTTEGAERKSRTTL
jgi:hypothetical protein